MNGTPENNIPQGEQRDPRFRERKLTAQERSVTGTRIVNAALFLFLGCLIAYILYLIFTKMQTWGIYNADIAAELSFRRACWEQGTLWPEGFVGCAESLVRSTVIPFLLFYAITKDLVLSYQLESVVSMVILLASLWYLLRKLKLDTTAKLIAACMFLGFMQSGVGERLPIDVWDLVIYPYPAYNLFSCTIFLSLGLRIEIVDRLGDGTGIRDKRLWIPIIILFFLVSCFAFTTIKLAMSLFVPLFCVDVFRFLLHFTNKKPKDKRIVFMLAVSTACLIIYAISYGCFTLLHGNTIVPEKYYIVDSTLWTDWNLIASRFWALFRTFGFSGQGELTSGFGIHFVLSCCVVLVECYALVWLFKKNRDDEGFGAEEQQWYFLSVTIVTLLLSTFDGRNDLSRSRFYFASALVLPIICAIAFNKWMDSGEQKKVVWPCAVMGAILFLYWGTTVKLNDNLYDTGYPEQDIVDVTNYLENEDYEYVVASFDNAGRIFNYSDGRVDYLHFLSREATTLSPYRWLLDLRKFDDEKLGERCILLLSDDEERAVNDSGGPVAWMLRDDAKKVTEIGPYNLYEMTENPFTRIEKVRAEHTAGLPAENVSYKIDYPYYIGFAHEHAWINDRGEAVSDGTGAGFTVFGPYTDTVPGVYDITVRYVIDSDEQRQGGTFDVAVDTQPIQIMNIGAENTSATMENVTITEPGHLVEIRVWVPQGVIIRVQSIEYRRVS